MTVSAQSIKKAKRPRVVTNLETKLKIIADFEARKLAVIRNVEVNLLWCKKSSLK
jgi:hypothetical protein